MIETLADAVARDPRYAQTTNLVVLRDGELVLERHYGDDSSDDLADVYSVTKSIVALVYGVALGEQKVPPPEAPLYEQFPEYPDLIAADARRRELTIGHALTMTLGLAWDEIGLPYGNQIRFDESDRDLLATGVVHEKLSPVVLFDAAASFANELLDACLIERPADEH